MATAKLADKSPSDQPGRQGDVCERRGSSRGPRSSGRSTARNQTSAAATISQHSYTLDNVGNRTQLQETLAKVGGGSTSSTLPYGLDRLYRLTSAGQPTSSPNAYTYDPVGNRLTKTNSPAMTYDKADRVTTFLYRSDPNGNLTVTPRGSFVYDQANRLTSGGGAGANDTYMLDGDGKRTQTVANAGVRTTITYVYDVARSLVVVLQQSEQGFSGTTTQKYVWGLGVAYSVDRACAHFPCPHLSSGSRWKHRRRLWSDCQRSGRRSRRGRPCEAAPGWSALGTTYDLCGEDSNDSRSVNGPQTTYQCGAGLA